ncbi:hypothetical protein DZA65_00697 [Dickeya dianthicola]|uniref:Uncharacterized protein n=3 Tax=Dickeya dianthicola TaxID=204039 RepID=A0AAP2CXJ1_9GAMM|nr:hypothetical protein DZA65_00697 [Dickeya dianthicola]MBI0437818.1 hypothetical protein [Dickeya dianthicola]MBI0447967.1 hypothetical protein [Dickeya dianthicola]MBI0452584.1 hypothetical protein [Dickeya dianthicola]MBI0457016.1 hypothetical protein [Dickeya dianthicola]
MQTETITLPVPGQSNNPSQAAQEQAQHALQNAEYQSLITDANILLEAVQAATGGADVPSIQQYRPDATLAGAYLQAHHGSVLRGIDDALRDVRISSPADTELLLRGFLIKLVNLSIRSKHSALNQARINKEAAQTGALGAELSRSLEAWMRTRKISEKFSAGEMALIREHVTAGRMNIANNMAGQDVQFLDIDSDWRAKADAMAMLPGSRSVTASIGTKDTGDSVSVQFRDGGWVLAWWNSAETGNGDNPGWVVIQCSENLQAVLQRERAQQREIDALLGRRRPQMQSKVFTDELS